jgi:putative holliday junction resolvase
MARILGIDYGRRRIGLAISDETEMLATPLLTVEVNGLKEAVARVAEHARARGAVRIVVGLPLNMDGTAGPMAEEVREYCRRLGEATGLPVEFWDERLSSGQAERVLLEADLSRARRKQVRDKLAAQLILQGFLDARSE